MNISKLTEVMPASVVTQIPDVINKFGINTPVSLAHFLSQCAHESGGFKITTENLNYSKEGLMKIFHKYFPTEQLASQYARQPKKIANKVYGNRMGNGNEASGEGWKYRGRGYIQITGKNNYQEFSKSIGEDVLSNPDLVSTKYPMVSSAWFFSKNCLGKCTDSSDKSVTNVTRCVNGGENGLIDRLKYFKTYYQLLS
jgi:putative chitinase